MKLSKDVHYHQNIVATPKAASLLGLSKLPAYDPKETVPRVIVIVTWHPWVIRSGYDSVLRVVRGPFYNVSSDNYQQIAGSSIFRFFIIENRVVAISFAPYLNFDDSVMYEIEDADGLVIYEKNVLALR